MATVTVRLGGIFIEIANVIKKLGQCSGCFYSKRCFDIVECKLKEKSIIGMNVKIVYDINL